MRSIRWSGRSAIEAQLPRGQLTQAAERARKPRLHGPGSDTQRLGHLRFRQLEEIAIRDDQTVLLAQSSQRGQNELAALARERRRLGRPRRIARGRVLDQV